MKILTPNGLVNDSSIKVGDKVLAYDAITGRARRNRVIEVHKWTKYTDKDNQGEFAFYLINNRWKLYKNQSIWVNDTCIHAKDVEIGDKLHLVNGTVTVTSVTKTTSKTWYRFKISGDHSFVGDDLLLHNASRFWIGGGTNTNWTASPTTNWCATSGGTTRVAAPTSSDDVTFDGAGAGNTNSTVSASVNVLSLTFTSGYTATITQNTAVIIGISGGFTDNTAHTWVVNGTGSLTLSGSFTITSGGKTYPGSVTFSGATTKVLSGNWNVTGGLTVSGNCTVNHTTAEILTVGNGLQMTSAMGGSITLSLTGGIWNGSGSLTVSAFNLSGAISVTGSVSFSGGVMTNNSATVTSTGSTLSCSASTTFDTAGIIWNNITLGGTSQTYTINSLLSATGTMTINGAVAMTFAGSSGFAVGTLTSSALNSFVHTLVHGVTYTVTTAFNCFKSIFSSLAIWTSDDATVKVIFNFQNGAACNVMASFTRFDASGGRPIYAFNGTITSCSNIFNFSDALPSSQSRIVQAGGSY